MPPNFPSENSSGVALRKFAYAESFSLSLPPNNRPHIQECVHLVPIWRTNAAVASYESFKGEAKPSLEINSVETRRLPIRLDCPSDSSSLGSGKRSQRPRSIAGQRSTGVVTLLIARAKSKVKILSLSVRNATRFQRYKWVCGGLGGGGHVASGCCRRRFPITVLTANRPAARDLFSNKRWPCLCNALNQLNHFGRILTLDTNHITIIIIIIYDHSSSPA